MMIVRGPPPLRPQPAFHFPNPTKHFFYVNAPLWLSAFHSKINCRVPFKCFCNKNGTTHEASSQGFSKLGKDVLWDGESVWSTMAFYMFSLHIPLSFGSLSVAAQIIHKPDLDPQTQALSVLAAQILELIGALLLLKSTAKPHYKFQNFFTPKKSSSNRNWLLASALGIGFLSLLVFSASFLADSIFGTKAANNPNTVKEILVSSDMSKVALVLVYCIITPLLEETIYRGFLLTSLSSTMKWQQAVVISSAIFSAAHLSAESSLQLFIIGCVLGCSYCWTGTLSSSVLIHSLYNSIILILTFVS